MDERSLVEERLVEAIAKRRVVRLAYVKDRGRGQRVGHPHILYRGSSGKLVVDIYQVAGYSSSGDLPQWRMFELAAIWGVDVLEDRFEPAPDFNPVNPARFARIIARIEG
jgi:hypothetical protein